VANRDVIQLPLVVQRGGDPLNFRIGRCYQMEASKYNADVRINFRGSFEHLLDARVRTSIHNDETLRAANLPGAISVVESTLTKLACGQGVLAENMAGRWPSK